MTRRTSGEARCRWLEVVRRGRGRRSADGTDAGLGGQVRHGSIVALGRQTGDDPVVHGDADDGCAGPEAGEEAVVVAAAPAEPRAVAVEEPPGHQDHVEVERVDDREVRRGLVEAEVVALPVTLVAARSEEHTSELQSLMRISY